MYTYIHAHTHIYTHTHINTHTGIRRNIRAIEPYMVISEIVVKIPRQDENSIKYKIKIYLRIRHDTLVIPIADPR